MIRCRAFRAVAGGPPAGHHPGVGRRTPPAREALARPEPATASTPPGAQKLLVIIVADADADPLVRAMVQRGHATTKIGSSGGFLRRGNTTLLTGVPSAEVEDVLALVRRLCPARTELLTLGALPLAGEVPFITEPVEVRAGGAVVFVLNVEHFERA